MATVGTLVVHVLGDASQLSRSLGGAERIIERFGSRMFFLGSRITAGVTLPIAGFSLAIGKMGVDLDSAMTESLAIMDDVSAEMRQKMQRRAQDLSHISKFSAAEIAKGYYDLASAGLNAEQAFQTIPMVTKFAQAGMLNMAEAGELLAGAVSSVGTELIGTKDKISGMARVADVLTKANNMALGTVRDFSTALTKQFGGAMKTYGVSLEEGVALLMGYAENNIKGARASTLATMAMRDVQVATIRAGEAWEKYGISVFDAAGELRSMPEVLDQVLMAMRGFSKEQIIDYTITGKRGTPGKPQSDIETTAMFREINLPFRSISAIQQLLSEKTVYQINRFFKGLKDAGGESEKVFTKQGQAIAIQWAAAFHRIQTAGQELFQAFKPILSNLIVLFAQGADVLIEWARAFQNADPWVKKLTISVAALLAVMGPAIAIMGSWILLASGFVGGMSGIFRVMTSILGLWPGMNAALKVNNALWAANKATSEAALAMQASRMANMAIPLGTRGTVVQRYVAKNAADEAKKAMDVARKAQLEYQAVMATTSLAVTGQSAIILHASKLWGQLGIAIRTVGSMSLRIVPILSIFYLLGPAIARVWESVSKLLPDLPDFATMWNKVASGAKLFLDTFVGLGHVIQFGWVQLVELAEFIMGDLDRAFLGLRDNIANLSIWGQMRDEAVARLGDIARTIRMLQNAWREWWGMAQQPPPWQGPPQAATGKESTWWAGRLAGRMSEGVSSFLAEGPKSYRRWMGIPEGPITGRGTGGIGGFGFSHWTDEQRTGAYGGWSPTGIMGAGRWPEDEDATGGIEKIDAKAQRIKDLYEQITGAGKRQWQDMTEVLAQHGEEILNNEDNLKRLWEIYKDVRLDVAADDTTALLDSLYAKEISIQDFEAFRETFGKIIDDLYGVQNPLETMAAIYDQFVAMQSKLLAGAGMAGKYTLFDPAFLKDNAENIEKLRGRYSELSPGLRQMVDEYDKLVGAMHRMDDAVRRQELSSKVLQDAYQDNLEMVARVADQRTELTNWELTESDRALRGISKNYHTETLKFNQEIAKRQSALNLMTDEQLNQGERLFQEFVRDGMELLELQKRNDLLRLASSVGVNALILRSHRKMTDSQIEGLIRARIELTRILALYDSLANTLDTFASVFDKEGEGWLTHLATVTRAMAQTKEAMFNVSESLDMMQNAMGPKGIDWEQMQVGVLGMAGAIGQMVQAMDRATSSSSKMKNIMGGAMVGAEIGAASGIPGGALGGAIIGGIIGALRGRGLRDVIRNVAKDWGVEISDELAKAIRTTMKEETGGNREVATLMHFADILEEAGGLNAGNFGRFQANFRNFLVMIDRGLMSSADGMGQYSENFGVFADYLTKRGEDLSTAFREHILTLTDMLRTGAVDIKDITAFIETNFDHFAMNLERIGGIASDAWLDFLQLFRDAGSPAGKMMDFLNAQMSTAGEAWGKVVEAITYSFDGLAESIQEVKDEIADLQAEEEPDQEKIAEAQQRLNDLLARQGTLAAENAVEMDRLASIILTTFNQGIANGQTWFQVLTNLQPALDALKLGFDNLGISSDNPAIQKLMELQKMFKDNEKLFTGIDAMTQGTIALSRLGGLRGAAGPIQEQMMEMFRRTQSVVAERGGTHAEALMPFLPFLTEMRRASEKGQIQLSEDIQRMIDQSIELGLMPKEALRTTEEILDAGFEGLIHATVDGSNRIVDALGSMSLRVPGEEGGGNGGGGGGGDGEGGGNGGDGEPLRKYGVGLFSGSTIEVPVYLDNRLVARGVVPHIPGEKKRLMGR